MSIRYLDFSGAVNFWTNIKNYILSKIPTKTSELTNDSGYITNTDTCLHKSGGETFTGYKTVENINSGLVFKSTNYQAEIRLSGNEPYDVSIVSKNLSNNTYSYHTLMDRYGKVFPHIYRLQASNLTVYVSNAVSNNDGDGLTANTAFSYSALRNFLGAIRMQSGSSLGGTYSLTVNLIPTGISYGTCRFDSTKMPYVKNLVIQTSTGIEGTPENYTTNCPDLLQLYISGNMDVTVRNIKCGEIAVYQGAKVTLTNFNAVGQVRADSNGYVTVGGYLYVFYYPLSTSPRVSLFDATLDGHIRIESTNTTINFSEQIYYTAGVLRAINHGYMYANISRWKLLGIKPCVIVGSSTTILTTCSTAGNVSAKTVETGTTIGTSTVIGVTFSETNTADSPTLNVNGLGDWSIVADNNAVDIKHYLPFGVRIIFKRFRNTWKITNTKDIFQYIASDCSMSVSGNLGTTYNNGEFNFGDYIVSQSTSSTNTGIYNAVQYNINGTNIFDGIRTITQPWVYTATQSIKLTTTIGGTVYQDKGIKFMDTNSASIGYLYGCTFNNGGSGVGLSASNVIDNTTVSKGIRVVLTNDGKSYLYPGNPDDTSLGSEYFTWKGVYANKYYLGNTEFGDIVTHNASEFLTQHQSLANYATKQDLADLVNSAPSTLDTLNELASALGNDPNFATTVSTQIGNKANDNAVVHLTGDETINGTKIFKSDKLISTSGNSYRIINNSNNSSDGYGVFQRIDSGNWYLMLTAKDDALGSWASPRPAVMSLSTGVLNINGNSATTTEFSANKSVTLTGDVTGTASSKAGWSVATTLANSGVTAGTYGPSADVTGNNNATISVPEITVDAKGRVTSVTNRTLTCKNNTYNVYNKTLTIQKNGTNVATFTSNSNTDVTANITVPTKVSELTNDSGYLTAHQSLSNYVTLNTAQEITNTKTFKDANTVVKRTDIEAGNTLPSADKLARNIFQDKNGKELGSIFYYKNTSGNTGLCLRAGDWFSESEGVYSLNASGTNRRAELVLYTNSNGDCCIQPNGYFSSTLKALSTSVWLGESTKPFGRVYANSFQFCNAGLLPDTDVQTTEEHSIGFFGKNNGPLSYITFQKRPNLKDRIAVRVQTSSSSYKSYDFDATCFYPESSNSVDIGSTTNIFKNIYCNNYYKGTTAFGDIVTHNASEFLTSHQSLDNYVTLNSNQTITAIKTITGGNQGKMIFKNPNYTKGDALESGVTISRLYFGNNASYDSSNAVLTTDVTATGISTVELCAINNTASNSSRASLILSYDKSATSPRLLKSWGNFVPYSSDNYTLGNSSSIWKECYSNAYYLGTTAFGDIVTHNASEFLTAHQSLSSCVKNVVTNNQTIKSTGITRGTAPSSAQTFGIAFSDNNNKYIGNIYGYYATDKSTYVGLYAYKGTTTSNGDNAYLRIGYDASGNVYTSAPTPATADNSTQIATTAFVKAQGYLTSHQSLANYVTTNTDQSISGIKSHSKHISILGDYIGNEFSTNARTCLYLKSNRDTDGQSGIYFSKFRQNVAQGALTGSNLVSLTLDVLENSVRTNNCISIDFRYFENDVPTKIYVIPKASMTSYMGTAGNPWTNAYITNLILNGNVFNPISTSGNVGDVVFASAYYSSIMGTADLDLTVSGDALYLAGFDNNTLVIDSVASSFAGTWKFLGIGKPTTTSGNADTRRTGLWKRIA